MDMNNYDAVIDTTGKEPKDVADEIIYEWAKTLDLKIQIPDNAY